MNNQTGLSTVLFRYLTKEFLIKFFTFLGIFLGVILLFETIELIRRSSGYDVSFLSLLQLALYKLPDVGQQTLPFITLFAAIAFFRSLSERQELVTVRAAGLSAWQFIIPVSLSAFLIGVIYISIVHPLSAASMSRYETLYNGYFKNGQSNETITLVENGLWLRQDDDNHKIILKADTLNAQNWTLDKVTVFSLDHNDGNNQRFDAKTATLKPGKWLFTDVTHHKSGEKPKNIPQLSLNTSLTTETIAESFSNPVTISFWQLPFFIASLEKTGLDTTEMRAYYQSLLSMPLFLTAMIFMAAIIGLNTQRVSSMVSIVAKSLILGFLAFFMSGFLKALSLGHEIPIILGIWTPSILILFTTISLLSKMEDG